MTKLTPSPYRMIAAAAVAVSTAIATPALAQSLSTTTVSAPTTVVGGPGSTQRDQIEIRAASRDAVVYELTHVMTTDLRSGAVPSSAPYELVARFANGTTKDLQPLDAQNANSAWSLADDTLFTVVHAANSLDVNWRNIVTDDHGSLSFSAQTETAGFLPQSVLTMEPNGTLQRTDFSDTTTTLARPFTVRPKQLHATNDSHGVVVSDIKGHAKYIAFDHPSKVRALRTHSHGRVVCSGVSTRFAACTTGGPPGAPGFPNRAALIPLDGSAPILAHDRRERGGPVALAGKSRLVWERFAPGPGIRLELGSLTAAAHARHVGTKAVAPYQLRSAYGKAVVVSSDQHRILGGSRPASFKTLLKAPRSPNTASPFALTDDRIVDVDDVINPAHRNDPVAFRSRSLTVTDAGVAVGAPQVVAPASHVPSDGVNRPAMVIGQVAASGDDVAYETARSADPARLHVVTAKRTVVIPKVRSLTPIALSGRWVMYYSEARDSGGLTVRNLVTGKVKGIPSVRGDSPRPAALAGHFVVYLKRNGSIVRMNLRTGETTAVAPVAGSAQRVLVFAWGSYVGWEYQRGGGSNGPFVDRIRNLDGSPSEVTTLSQRLLGLSSAGALLSNTAIGVGDDASTAPPFGPGTISLRDWSGTTTQVLPNAVYGSVPEANGNVLAWLTQDGTLNAAKLSPSP